MACRLARATARGSCWWLLAEAAGPREQLAFEETFGFLNLRRAVRGCQPSWWSGTRAAVPLPSCPPDLPAHGRTPRLLPLTSLSLRMQRAVWELYRRELHRQGLVDFG